MNDTSKKPRIRFLASLANFFRTFRKSSDQKNLPKRISKRRRKSSPVHKVCAALPGKIESSTISEAEKWFIKQLLILQKKNLKLKKSSAVNGSSVLINFYAQSFEISNIYDSLILLKNGFVKEKKERDGLRMLELANIFRRPSPEEIRWGLSVAAREKIVKGMWLGEASLLYTSNGHNPDCKIILEESAKQGNDLSQFILKNS